MALYGSRRIPAAAPLRNDSVHPPEGAFGVAWQFVQSQASIINVTLGRLRIAAGLMIQRAFCGRPALGAKFLSCHGMLSARRTWSLRYGSDTGYAER